jgi:hypothetical protein
MIQLDVIVKSESKFFKFSKYIFKLEQWNKEKDKKVS